MGRQVHRCRAAGCTGKAFDGKVICHQHQHIVGWRLSARLQQAWSDRVRRPEELDSALRQLNVVIEEVQNANSHSHAKGG
jgi:hypothetical protein